MRHTKEKSKRKKKRKEIEMKIRPWGKESTR